jgi:hypothetical protein
MKKKTVLFYAFLGLCLSPLSAQENLVQTKPVLADDKLRLLVGTGMGNTAYTEQSSQAKHRMTQTLSVGLQAPILSWLKIESKYRPFLGLEYFKAAQGNSIAANFKHDYIVTNVLVGLDYPILNNYDLGLTLGVGSAGDKTAAIDGTNAKNVYRITTLAQAQARYRKAFGAFTLGAQVAVRQEFSKAQFTESNALYKTIDHSAIQARLEFVAGWGSKKED